MTHPQLSESNQPRELENIFRGPVSHGFRPDKIAHPAFLRDKFRAEVIGGATTLVLGKCRAGVCLESRYRSRGRFWVAGWGDP